MRNLCGGPLERAFANRAAAQTGRDNDGTFPPFRKDFYFVALVTNAGGTKITYDNTNVTKLNSFLVFQSPGLLYSFYRDNSAQVI